MALWLNVIAISDRPQSLNLNLNLGPKNPWQRLGRFFFSPPDHMCKKTRGPAHEVSCDGTGEARTA